MAARAGALGYHTPVTFQFLARPLWVNLLLLVPFLSFYFWRRSGGLRLGRTQLIAGGLFGIAFGFLEAVVVVYLRASLGLVKVSDAALEEVFRLSPQLYSHPDLLKEVPASLLRLEIAREAATIVMLVTVALLAAPARRERWAMFLWTFAWWDLLFYGGLRVVIGWPQGLTTPDVLFLIPEPWLAQVWFPLMVSGLTLAAVLAGTLWRNPHHGSTRISASS